MGKKNKKLSTQNRSDNHLPSAEGEIELKGDFNSETNNSTHSINQSKKKRKLDSLVNDVHAQLNSEEIDEPEIEKKKKKKRPKNNEQQPSDEVRNESVNILTEDLPHISKKKKKKTQMPEEDIKQDIEEVSKIDDHKPHKDKKKNKNKNTIVSDVKQENEIVPDIVNTQTHKKNKKAKKKAKTGAPVLNDEEAQVTEEDINKFIDELDEEDNKQYEDWVKLLDARLSKKTKAE